MRLKASTVGAISTNLVGGKRTEESPRPNRAALSARARTGWRPRFRITYVVPNNVIRRSAVMVTAERISVQSSVSIDAEEGVTASTAYTTGWAAMGMRVSFTLTGMKGRTQAGTLDALWWRGDASRMRVRPSLS